MIKFYTFIIKLLYKKTSQIKLKLNMWKMLITDNFVLK